MRQISLHDTAATRQMHILTTRTDMGAAEVRYRMGSRWRQENHYRYARIHFDLDAHDPYRLDDDDADAPHRNGRPIPGACRSPSRR